MNSDDVAFLRLLKSSGERHRWTASVKTKTKVPSSAGMGLWVETPVGSSEANGVKAMAFLYPNSLTENRG
jgi:hypothetical protein